MDEDALNGSTTLYLAVVHLACAHLLFAKDAAQPVADPAPAAMTASLALAA